jgi:hypothetical protein
VTRGVDAREFRDAVGRPIRLWPENRLSYREGAGDAAAASLTRQASARHPSLDGLRIDPDFVGKVVESPAAGADRVSQALIASHRQHRNPTQGRKDG